jgi:hypothetical protein
MANELTVACSVAFSKGGVNARLDVSPTLLTVAGTHGQSMSQSIGFAAAEALNLGEMGTVGQVVIVNLDATNFVNVLTGVGGVIFAKIKPGDFLKLPVGSGAQQIYLQADTAAVMVEYIVIEA